MSQDKANQVVTFSHKTGVTTFSPEEVRFLEERIKDVVEGSPLPPTFISKCTQCVDRKCVGYDWEDERFKGVNEGCLYNEMLLLHLLKEIKDSADDDYPLIYCIPWEQEVCITRVFDIIVRGESDIGTKVHSSALFFQYREMVPGERVYTGAWLIPHDSENEKTLIYPSRLDLSTLRDILRGEC